MAAVELGRGEAHETMRRSLIRSHHKDFDQTATPAVDPSTA